MVLVYHGYTGRLAALLSGIGVEPGDRVRVVKDGEVFEGVLMPRYTVRASEDILVIKLENGYNIGIKVDERTQVSLASKKSRLERVAEPEEAVESKAKIVLLSTGGTIASKIDYETGAVVPALSTREITEWAPDLTDIAVFEAREVMRVFSEDITPSDWERLANEVYREMKRGVNGAVIAHGTDMMSYSAAALAFAIRDKPVPIVFVGSQRSSDRPSSDSILNLKGAFITASRAPIAESLIAMHASTSDDLIAVHRGVKVRKMHTSRRDAFQSINDKPIFLVNPYTSEVKQVGKILKTRDPTRTPSLEARFDDKVALVKAYPGVQNEIIDMLVDKGFHGIVIEGSGLGHISNRLLDSIKRAVESGVPVVMTSQCLFGRVNLNVYSTGRRLLEAGVIPAEDMLPEVAYVKLSWVLASKTRDIAEVRKWMLTNLEGEINYRHTLDLYPRWLYE
ncbi:glutamyl-tRNA(Gln) amidotransferase subunit D [Thermogladius calderae 1633]|uniref:Glutamyl-tRNA(Gln) amidotransferase subunit D n=1 Tax=Thermogladius calderae (strain DSM 22663 / VKM B-2946 / 1633) TaxID=1184251 RepID=I3TCI9_THEC1|nr:Glu-tRNA(Gln) amidotransferase subunit GatD [Thermogladius calderae]AFK50477.1 glutamyl-tRNA(Gln) amidotransferase subunit D [Thermogladius calderae 1633]